MRFSLDIDYSLDKAEASRRRMDARYRYEIADRVPVGFCVVPRYFAPHLGLTYRDFFTDVETHYYWQLQFAKFRMEQIPEDMFCTGPSLWVYPFFDNVLDSDALGAEVVWPENETLQACPTIHTVEAMEAFTIPPPTAGLWGRQLDWCAQMRDFAAETRLTIGGQEAQVSVGAPSIGGLSPHMLAVDLIGVDFYWWLMEYPEACHRFLDKLTTALIQTQRYFEEVWPRGRGGFGLAEDSAQIMSLASFREFCVPYDLRLYETLGAPGGDRGLHMCGDSTHLHPALDADLHLTDFNIFGYLVAPPVAARNLGGKMRMWGNINPMLMKDGSKAEVKAAARACLQALAPCGGLLLGDGANVCPGTPLEHLAALTEAAEEYGKGEN